METSTDQNAQVTLSNVLPFVCNLSDRKVLSSIDMKHIRLVNKDCRLIVDERWNWTRLSISCHSPNDCTLGAKFLKRVVSKTNNINEVTIRVSGLGNGRLRRRVGPPPPPPNAEVIAARLEAYSAPLRAFAATQHWINLKNLELDIRNRDTVAFGMFTAANFPILEKLTLANHELPEDLQLELPALLSLHIEDCILVSRNLKEFLCNDTNLPYLVDLSIINLKCDDLQPFEDIKHKNLKTLNITFFKESYQVLHHLRLGAAKSLGNLERLSIYGLWLSPDLNPAEMLFDDLKLPSLKELSFVFPWDAKDLDAQDIITIAHACPRLEVLEMDDASRDFEENSSVSGSTQFDMDDSVGNIYYYFNELAIEQDDYGQPFPYLRKISFPCNWTPPGTPIEPDSCALVRRLAERIWPYASVYCDRWRGPS